MIHIPIWLRISFFGSPIGLDLSSISSRLSFRFENLKGKTLKNILSTYNGSKLGIGLGLFVSRYWLSNSAHIKLRIFGYGATLIKLVAAYKSGITLQLRTDLTEFERNDLFLIRRLEALNFNIGKPQDNFSDDLLSVNSGEDVEPLLSEEQKKQECSICTLELGEEELDRYICVHQFHLDCSKRWISTCKSRGVEPSCPICRMPIY
jgi:hypothetical protein